MSTPDGINTASFALGVYLDEKDREQPRLVVLREPTEGQMYVLTRVVRLADGGARDKLAAVQHFGDVLEALFVQPDDRDYAYRGLTDGTIEAKDFAGLAAEVIRHFKGGDEGPVKSGPTTTRRAARARR